ncbi:MAG: PEP-CTERM sorting domain-containing protein [Calditrichaeota bacterium]|nr:MAG: PEP-CTERM sorting domain-containing protein [Calditrichota bacterium]
MKKVILTLAIMLLAFGVSNSGVYTFNPSPADMYDLDHGYYYGWGIDHDFSGETISGVRLTITDINNWWPEPNVLFMHLVDDMSAGLTVYEDNNPDISDAYDGQGVLIDAWTDYDGGPRGDFVTISYDFASLGILDEFISYAADGNFGFGVDPDCHFFNDKFSLTVVTDAPEPTTMLLFAMGLVGGGILRKKFSA